MQNDLGATPYDEEGVQVSNDPYIKRMRIEIMIYRDQLRRLFPSVAERFKIVWNKHDLGNYGSVVFIADETNRREREQLQYIDKNLPAHWDSISYFTLGLSQTTAKEKGGTESSVS